MALLSHLESCDLEHAFLTLSASITRMAGLCVLIYVYGKLVSASKVTGARWWC